MRIKRECNCFLCFASFLFFLLKEKRDKKVQEQLIPIQRALPTLPVFILRTMCYRNSHWRFLHYSAPRSSIFSKIVRWAARSLNTREGRPTAAAERH